MNLNFFKTQKKFKKSEHQPNPDLYWRAILFVTFILIFLSFVFGAYLYLNINKEDFLSTVEYNGQSKKIGKDRIDEALEYFTERANKSENILNLPSPLIDPSL